LLNPENLFLYNGSIVVVAHFKKPIEMNPILIPNFGMSTKLPASEGEKHIQPTKEVPKIPPNGQDNTIHFQADSNIPSAPPSFLNNAMRIAKRLEGKYMLMPNSNPKMGGKQMLNSSSGLQKS
jgi:hypothetical protein